MEGKGNKIITDSKKLKWEAPMLISLDKGKTEGGFTTGTTEDGTYSNPAS
jgi:hypothetical protein